MSDDLTLLKTQKNELYKILESNELNPSDFSWDVRESKMETDTDISVLFYRERDFYFQFDFTSDQWCLTYAPAKEKRSDFDAVSGWNDVTYSLKIWIDLLKKELDAPDLWQEIEKYQEAFSITPPEDLTNEPIPAYEVEQVAKSIAILADRIEESFELSKEQNTFVRSRLAYLVDSAKRQLKLDWIHTNIGVLVTISAGLALAPEQAHELWQLFKSIVGQSIQFVGRLLK